ncbi:MAG: hypothetical protein K2L87_06310, partial [Clostridiales bacterium]|nr:hypothetical protein [Clostridiales bacterium]
KNDGDFVNGYADNVKDRAGTYTAKVALKVTDPDHYAFSDGSTEKIIEYTFTIDKATLDPSSIKWQYTDASGSTKIYDPTSDGIPWKGTNYTLTLTGLPDGVTVNPGNVYTGNQQKAVGTYTATCTSLSYDTNNYNTIASPTLSWTIKPQEIEINNTSWILDPHPIGSETTSSVLYLPHLNSPYDGSGIVYKYYYLEDNGTVSEVDVTQIVSESGVTRHYYVEAVLASGKSTDALTDWDQALVLNDITDPEPANGKCTMAFDTGDNRAPVSVVLNGNPATYDGKEHGKLNEDLFIRVGANEFSGTFTVDYYIYDDTQPNNQGARVVDENGDPCAPKNAGDYLIVVTLSEADAEDYYLNATTFKYTILPYELNMSGVRWGYVDENGDEIVYNASLPPMYAIKDGMPMEYVMKLVGFPKGDENGTDEEQLAYAMFLESVVENLFTYTGNVSSSVGSYTAHYTCDESALSGNFKLVAMPDPSTELPEEQGWKIAAREIVAPKNDSSAVFSGSAYDLLALGGLDPAGLGVYYRVNSFSTKNEFNEKVDLNIEDVQNAIDAGAYDLTVDLIDKSNVKWLVGGSLKQSAQAFKITINKLTVTVTDWEGDEEEPFVPTDSEGNNLFEQYPDLVESYIVDMNGEDVIGDDWQERWNERFKQTIRASEGNEQNIEFVFDGVDEWVIFQRPDEVGNESEPIARPVFTGEGATEDGTGKTVTFTGSTIDFTPDNIEALKRLIEGGKIQLFSRENGVDTPADLEYFKQREAGDYTMVIKINGQYKWSDTNDKSDAVLSFTVAKAEVKGAWKTGEDGMPKFELDEGSKGYENLLEYEYFDADGNPVSADQLTKGKTYTASVRIKDGEKKNAALFVQDENGEWVEEEVSTEEFTVPGRNTLANMLGLPEDFPLIQVVCTVLFTLLFLIFLIMWIKYGKARRASKEIIEQYEDLNT